MMVFVAMSRFHYVGTVIPTMSAFTGFEHPIFVTILVESYNWARCYNSLIVFG